MTYEYVHGVENELQKLAELPAKIEANVTRGAVRAAARVVQLAAIARAPVGSGLNKWKSSPVHLRDTIRISSSVKQGVASAIVKVGNPKKGVFYEAMVLGGTRAHLIKAKLHGWLSFGGLVRQVVQHPGARAQPFMAQADAASRETALKAAFDYADDKLRQIFSEQGN
jgi:HK97 gp10 family phage protein